MEEKNGTATKPKMSEPIGKYFHKIKATNSFALNNDKFSMQNIIRTICQIRAYILRFSKAALLNTAKMVIK